METGRSTDDGKATNSGEEDQEERKYSLAFQDLSGRRAEGSRGEPHRRVPAGKPPAKDLPEMAVRPTRTPAIEKGRHDDLWRRAWRRRTRGSIRKSRLEAAGTGSAPVLLRCPRKEPEKARRHAAAPAAATASRMVQRKSHRLLTISRDSIHHRIRTSTTEVEESGGRKDVDSRTALSPCPRG